MPGNPVGTHQNRDTTKDEPQGDHKHGRPRTARHDHWREVDGVGGRRRVRRADDRQLRVPDGARHQDPDVHRSRGASHLGVPRVRPAARRGEDEPEPDEPKKTPRTHWDMLLERRKVDELEVLLNERLEALRSGEVYRERVSG